jgi:glycosyltransferase involved in cell wall biosynthesis
MKTIAVFHPSVELYGADRILVNALKVMDEYRPIIYLPKSGPLVTFIEQEIPYAKVVICEDLPIIYRAMFTPSGAVSFMKKYRRFSRFFSKENNYYNFEIAYVNTLACSFLLRILNQQKIKSFTHVHEILERPKIAAVITSKLAFRYSELVISVSRAVEQNLIGKRIIRKRKSVIVHNGILPIPDCKKQKSDKVNFYLFGRIKPEKGQWYLLDALANLPKEVLKKAKFNLVGGTLAGKEFLKTDLLTKIHELGLTDFVNLKGFTSDISGEMAKADVCLVPSLMKDPFPTTVLEAMSAGKAVITTNTGGAKEAILNGGMGFVIPPNRPDIFAQTIQKLILEPSLSTKVGQKAKSEFEKRFTMEQFRLRWTKMITML